MPTYEQLYHLNLSNLKASAERWEETVTKFKGLHSAYGDQVARPFRQAGWTQPVLTAAKADNDVRAAHQEFEDAHKEAKGIAGVLTTLHAELKTAKDDLHHLADVEAKQQDLHVSPTGVVTPRNDLSQDPMRHHDPDAQAIIREQHEACDAFARRLERVLQRAADADDTACWALRRDLGGNKTDFNSKVVTSLDDADATHAAELLKKGDKLTDTQLAELNHLMKANRNDPVFATRFYQQLGQEGTLQMYGQLALQTTDASDKRKTLLQQMQRNMGNTLATATDPDNKPHLSEQWSADLRKLGTQHIQLGNNSVREGPYGYQLLGGILRYGNYDSAFLTPVAEHVTQLHAEDPYFFAGTSDDTGDPQHGYNPSGKNGAGYDPMNSVLEALGHSPQAATDYFTPPMEAYAKDGAHTGTLTQIGDADNYLDYLVSEDYESFRDMTGHDPDAAQRSANDFPDSLGHALEAATTGRPAGADLSSGPLAHTQEQADLAAQVISKFSGPEAGGLLNSDDGTAPYAAASDSLGNIGAEYMGDIQRSISGQTGLPIQGASAELDPEATREFVYQVGQHPDAYAALTGSQQAYTSALIDAEINGPSDSEVSLPQRISSAAHPGAEVAGIMSAARAHAVHDTHAYEDADYNGGVDTANKWVGRGLGLALGRIPVAGDVAGWVAEDVQESVANSVYQDTTSEARSEAGRIYTSGESALRESVRADIARSGGSEDLQNAVGRETDQSYGTGAEWGDQYRG
ncbi:DUF6571 family protein [Streptomyces blattellae]|uniref:DUF6571 family protein n=1 Tax=Streptomyces blattellae TaxID=2569855 RepID=UPI0018ACD950|nr:DUF6571 family protein [Streptomyces blattellae]